MLEEWMATDAERVRSAMESGDPAELEWAMSYAEEKRGAVTDTSVRAYWDEIIRRIRAARER